MSCNILNTILKGCESNIGGITSILINDMDNLGTVAVDSNAWEVTSFGTLVDEFVAFEFRRNTGSYTEELQNEFVNGSQFYLQTINLMFHRREASKSKAIKILGEGQRDLALVVGDANGKYWYFANAQLSAVSEGSGQAKADGSKYAVTFTAESVALAYEVDPAIVPALTTPIS
jgi:hypothetical protein